MSEASATGYAACHGEQPQGLVGPAPTRDHPSDSASSYFDVIAEGRTRSVMPTGRAAGMADAAMSALLAFFKAKTLQACSRRA